MPGTLFFILNLVRLNHASAPSNKLCSTVVVNGEGLDSGENNLKGLIEDANRPSTRLAGG